MLRPARSDLSTGCSRPQNVSRAIRRWKQRHPIADMRRPCPTIRRRLSAEEAPHREHHRRRHLPGARRRRVLSSCKKLIGARCASILAAGVGFEDRLDSDPPTMAARPETVGEAWDLSRWCAPPVLLGGASASPGNRALGGGGRGGAGGHRRRLRHWHPRLPAEVRARPRRSAVGRCAWRFGFSPSSAGPKFLPGTGEQSTALVPARRPQTYPCRTPRPAGWCQRRRGPPQAREELRVGGTRRPLVTGPSSALVGAISRSRLGGTPGVRV